MSDRNLVPGRRDRSWGGGNLAPFGPVRSRTPTLAGPASIVPAAARGGARPRHRQHMIVPSHTVCRESAVWHAGSSSSHGSTDLAVRRLVYVPVNVNGSHASRAAPATSRATRERARSAIHGGRARLRIRAPGRSRGRSSAGRSRKASSSVRSSIARDSRRRSTAARSEPGRSEGTSARRSSEARGWTHACRTPP